MTAGCCLYIAGGVARVSTSIGSARLGTTLGGASVNIAAAAAICGRRPFVVSVVGTDLSANEHQTLSLVANTEYLAVSPGATCRFDFHYPELVSRPTITSNFGVAKDLTRHCTSVEYANSWLHISCRNPLDARLIVGHALRSGVRGLSMDFIESSLEAQLDNVMDCLRHVTYVFLNSRELEQARPTLSLANYRGFVVVTDGPDASLVFHGDEVVAKSTPRQCAAVVDPTGAGDAFAGAFLALCSSESDIKRALSAANITAAKVLRGLGIESLVSELTLGGHHET